MSNKTTEAFEAWWADTGEQSLFALGTTMDDDIKTLAGIAWEAAIREVLAEPEITTPDVCGEVCARAKLCYGCNKAFDEALAKQIPEWVDIDDYEEPVKQEPLCEDEGCPHRGSPHICIEKPVTQEPVAVVEVTYGREPECYVTGNIDDFPEGVFKLYAAPVDAKAIRAEREWVDLTDVDRNDIETNICPHIDSHDFELIGNAYIAAFKEKNK